MHRSYILPCLFDLQHKGRYVCLGKRSKAIVLDAEKEGGGGLSKKAAGANDRAHLEGSGVSEAEGKKAAYVQWISTS